MPWCLPDRNPIYWDDMRRRFLGKGKFRVWRAAAALVGYGLLSGLFLFITIQLIYDDGGPNHETAAYLWLLLMVIQALVILLFGPLAAVNVIAGERERESLELLFLTPVSSRSLLLQKFSGAVTLVALVLLTFLPAVIAAYCGGGSTLLLFFVWYLVLAAQITCTISIGMLASCLIANTRMASVVSFTVTILLPVALSPLFPYMSVIDQYSKDANWVIPVICFMPLLAAITRYCLSACICRVERQRSPARR